MNAESFAMRNAAQRTATLLSFDDHQVFAIHMTPADAAAAGVCHGDAFFVVHASGGRRGALGERASFRFAVGVPLETLLTVVHERFQSIPSDLRVALAYNLRALADNILDGVVDPHQDNLEKHLRVAENVLKSSRERRVDPIQDAVNAFADLESAGFPAHEADSYTDTARRVIEHMRVAAGHADDAADARAALVQAVGPTRAEQMLRDAREARTTPNGAPCPACARMSTAAGGPVGCPAHEPERYLR